MVSPLELELNWESIWNYLALDVARTLQHELCIPGDLEQLQKTTREALAEHYATEQFGTSSGLLCFKLTADLRSVFREHDLVQFFLWGDYLSDLVVSRVGEFFWMSAVYGIEEVPRPDWLTKTFSEIRDEMHRLRAHLDDLLESLEFSSHDETISKRVRRSNKSMLNHLGLVTKYNLFARVWHQKMGQATLAQLREVYVAGKLLAQKRDVDETAVCFPGFWESGPQRAILNLDSK
jgi:hypothetical protein